MLPDHWVAQQYLPDVLQGGIFYQPSEQGFEATVGKNVTKFGKHNWPFFIRSLQLKNQVFQIFGEARTWTVPGI
ncbi:MAG: hypothetical protein Ct9H300mP28_29050 [Pseudomonadota bacterium]|nr:MAG: hypothetical protein Ct9H300mP28_29050 [Pseudomonadota bacterium]